MNRHARLILILSFLIFLSGCTSGHSLSLDEKLSLLETVRRYYYDLETANYRNALGYVLIPSEKKDASGFEINNKAHALGILARDTSYTVKLISLREEVYDYRSREGLYTVTALLRIETGASSRDIEETLHLTRPIDHWKICEIESSDPFVPLRSNLYWFYADPQTE